MPFYNIPSCADVRRLVVSCLGFGKVDVFLGKLIDGGIRNGRDRATVGPEGLGILGLRSVEASTFLRVDSVESRRRSESGIDQSLLRIHKSDSGRVGGGGISDRGTVDSRRGQRLSIIVGAGKVGGGLVLPLFSLVIPLEIVLGVWKMGVERSLLVPILMRRERLGGCKVAENAGVVVSECATLRN
jgi:hypothetical protein